MEELAGWGVFGIVIWWFYRCGKRIGSRKGYNVGRRRGRLAKRSR